MSLAIDKRHDLGPGILCLQQEGSKIGSIERMAHAAHYLAAGGLDGARRVALHGVAEGEIRSQEEPGVSAPLHDRLGRAGRKRVGVPGPVHADR
jgi:hypothetical protein